MIALSINGKSYDVDVEDDTPLLWVLRDTLGLTGTKYGCGIAQCGCCTVHIDGVATRSCQVPVGTVGGKAITTIEALAQNGKLHPVQQALARFRRAAMRLLPERHDDGGGGAAQGKAEADRRRYRRGDHQYLPLRHLSARSRRDSRRCRQRLTARPSNPSRS